MEALAGCCRLLGRPVPAVLDVLYRLSGRFAAPLGHLLRQQSELPETVGECPKLAKSGWRATCRMMLGPFQRQQTKPLTSTAAHTAQPRRVMSEARP